MLELVSLSWTEKILYYDLGAKDDPRMRWYVDFLLLL